MRQRVGNETLQGRTFYLVGNFNAWRPGDPAWRFQEVDQEYGPDDNGFPHEDLRLGFGSYSLEARFSKRQVIQFKVVEGASWDHQWTVNDNDPQVFTRHVFQMHCGLAPHLLPYCGAGRPSHAEILLEPNRYRFDFHPASQTLTIHKETKRQPGVHVFKWRDFAVSPRHSVSTWVALPYGYGTQGYAYPTCLVFDGRNLLVGEDAALGIFNRRERQIVPAFDLLARQGLIPPMILVGIGAPRDVGRMNQGERLGAHVRRNAYAKKDSDLQKAFLSAILETLLPALQQKFTVSRSPDGCFLMGHSNGGDFALRLLSLAPERFAGAVCLSAANPSRNLEGLQNLETRRKELRIALSYGTHDLSSGFLLNNARARRQLLRMRVPNIVTAVPEGTHEPEDHMGALYPLLAFVITTGWENRRMK